MTEVRGVQAPAFRRESITSPRDAYERERWQLGELERLHGLFVRSRRRWLSQWGVAGELLRILVDPYTGRYEARAETLRMALVAAVVAELLLGGQAGCQDVEVDGPEPAAEPTPGVSRPGRVVPAAVLVATVSGHDGAPVALRLPDEAQRWVAGRILGADRPRSAHDWITSLATRPAQPQPHAGLGLACMAEELVARRLIAAGVARRVVVRSRWTRRAEVRLVAIDGYATGFLNAGHRIPRLMSERRPVEPGDIMIAGLLDRIGLSRQIRRETTYDDVPLGHYVSSLPEPLRLLLRHAYAAFGSATSLGV